MLNPFRFIEFNAKVHSSRMALEDEGAVTSYAQLYVLSKRIAGKLARIGVRPGDLVVTCLPPGLDWLVTAALFHEACITCSNHGYVPIDPALGARWIISNRRQAHFPEEQLIYIDQEWFADTIPEAVARPRTEYASASDLCRLVLTSGTTGQAKGAAYTVAMLDARLRATQAYWVVPRGEINLMGFSTIGGFMTALSAAFTGNAYFAHTGPGRGIVKTIRQYRIRGLAGAPLQLARLLEHVDQPLPSVKEIRSGGGPLSPTLIAALRDSFRAEIFNVYGSTEVGGVAMCAVQGQYNPAVAGHLLDGVEVGIVDETGAELPAAAEGIVRLRTPSMVQGYHRNAAATAEFFKDGWFYPGDRGRLLENGVLALSGRGVELINRGGVKIDPALADEFLLAYPGVQDGAAFGVEDASGVQELAVAVCVAEGFSLEDLRTAFRQKFGDARTPKYYFRSQEIPRNPMGKVKRLQLHAKFSQALQATATAGAVQAD